MRPLAGLAVACCFAAATEAGAQTPPAAPPSWQVREVVVGPPAARSVDTLRLTIARTEFEDDRYEIALTRDWPRAFRLEAGRFDLAVTPHAGLGVGATGGQAEAGATLTLQQRTDDALRSRLSAMGVRDGAEFGDQGRWYLFAAASGRAVGLNMRRAEGGWDRAGWSTDPSSALIGDAQLGVAWKKGPMQTSLGLIHREVKGRYMLMGQEAKDDQLIAFSLSIKPGR